MIYVIIKDKIALSVEGGIYANGIYMHFYFIELHLSKNFVHLCMFGDVFLISIQYCGNSGTKIVKIALVS